MSMEYLKPGAEGTASIIAARDAAQSLARTFAVVLKKSERRRKERGQRHALAQAVAILAQSSAEGGEV